MRVRSIRVLLFINSSTECDVWKPWVATDLLTVPPACTFQISTSNAVLMHLYILCN